MKTSQLIVLSVVLLMASLIFMYGNLFFIQSVRLAVADTSTTQPSNDNARTPDAGAKLAFELAIIRDQLKHGDLADADGMAKRLAEVTNTPALIDFARKIHTTRLAQDDENQELSTLRPIMVQAQSSSDASQVQSLLQQMLDQTNDFLHDHPQAERLWAMRAAASIVLNRQDIGHDAASHLKTLGAMRSHDETIQQVMTQLNAHAWLKDSSDDSAVAPQPSSADPAQIIAPSVARNDGADPLVGTFSNDKYTLTISAVGNDHSGTLTTGQTVRNAAIISSGDTIHLRVGKADGTILDVPARLVDNGLILLNANNTGEILLSRR